MTADSLTQRSSLLVDASQSGVIANKPTSPSPSRNPAIVDHAAAAATDLVPHPALAETATAPSPSPVDVDHVAVAGTDPAPHPALAEAATDLSPSPVAEHAAVAATDPAPRPATNPHIIRAAALAADSR